MKKFVKNWRLRMTDAYNTHLEQMKDGYLTLFDDELYKKAKGGPLHGHSRIAKVETIDDLINLKFINEVTESFFDYEKDKGRVGLNLPAFVHVKQCEWNPNKFNEKIKEPTILAILDYVSNSKRPLRESLLDELLREKHLYGDREIEFNTTWGEFTINWGVVGSRCVNKKNYVVLPYYIWNEDLEIKEHHTKESKKYRKKEREKLFPYNAQKIKDLIEVAEKYIQIVESSEFSHEEVYLIRLFEGIAKVFTNADDPRSAEVILQNFRLGNVTLINKE